MSIDAKYPSKIRVERDGYLVYAEGDDIPETDTTELEAQGYAKPKAQNAPAEKKPTAKAAGVSKRG